nr:MAG TPA: hypothetical protein [Caudoviricetes sp.]
MFPYPHHLSFILFLIISYYLKFCNNYVIIN